MFQKYLGGAAFDESPNEPSQKFQEQERIGESRKRAKARETEMAAARGRGDGNSPSFKQSREWT